MNNSISIAGVKIRMDQPLNMRPHWDYDALTVVTEVNGKFINHSVEKYAVNGKDISFCWDHYKHNMTVGEYIEREDQIYYFLGGGSNWSKSGELISPHGNYQGTLLDHSLVSSLIIGYTLRGRDGLFTSHLHYGTSVLVDKTKEMEETGSAPVPVYELSHVDKEHLDEVIRAVLAFSYSDQIEIHLKNNRAVITKGWAEDYWDRMIISGDWKLLEKLNVIIEQEMSVESETVPSPYVVSCAWGRDVVIRELLSGDVVEGYRKCTIDNATYVYRSNYDLDTTIYNLYET